MKIKITTIVYMIYKHDYLMVKKVNTFIRKNGASMRL